MRLRQGGKENEGRRERERVCVRESREERVGVDPCAAPKVSKNS